MPTSRQLRRKAEQLFIKSGRRWISASASRRLYHRALSHMQAARLAERREREDRNWGDDQHHGRPA